MQRSGGILGGFGNGEMDGMDYFVALDLGVLSCMYYLIQAEPIAM
jgi:hypothetical protein